jgi:hypothetical protein
VANRLATAEGVATVSAAERLFFDQLETKASAAAAALGLSTDGKAPVVVVLGDVVVVGETAKVECPALV